jgi:hypothetical protein
VLPPEANLMADTHYQEALDLQKEWVTIYKQVGWLHGGGQPLATPRPALGSAQRHACASRLIKPRDL